jgi:hypothetical protein
MPLNQRLLDEGKNNLQVCLYCAVTISQLNKLIGYSCHVTNIPNSWRGFLF